MPRPRRPNAQASEKNKKNTTTLAAVRAALQAQYATTFGCPWTEAPWGTSWADVFSELERADRAYKEAEQALTTIYGALKQGREVLEAHRIPLNVPFSEDKAVGLTTAEFALYYFFNANEQAMVDAVDWADWMLNLITMPARRKLSQDNWVAEGVRLGAQAAIEGRVHESLASSRATLDAVYRLGCVRVLRRWDRKPGTGVPLDEPVMRATVPGPPPRAPGSLEWRRAIVVELLDVYPLKTPSGEWRLPDDEDLAVVSLLHGALAELEAQVTGLELIAKGKDPVLQRERKAITESRKRRGTTPAMIAATKRARAEGAPRTVETAERMMKSVLTSGLSGSASESGRADS